MVGTIYAAKAWIIRLGTIGTIRVRAQLKALCTTAPVIAMCMQLGCGRGMCMAV